MEGDKPSRWSMVKGWRVISEPDAYCANCRHPMKVGEPAYVNWPYLPDGMLCEECAYPKRPRAGRP